MIKHSLKNLSILVIRPKPQGEILCEKIRALGGKATYFPTIEIALPQNIAEFITSISMLNQCDILVFISPQSVYASAAAIHQIWPVFPNRVKVAAVGASTAQALREANLPVDFFPEKEWSSENLLELSELQIVKEKKIVIVRGEGGREVLSETLKKRGAEVINAFAYRRLLPQVETSEYIHLLREHKIDIIVGTSYEAIQNLKILIGEFNWPILCEVPLLVISERIATLAKALGFVKIFIAKNASDGAIIEELIRGQT